jgi:hypothetical protein
MGSRIEGSSFSGLFTRVEIGHMRIGSAGTAASDRAGPAPRSASARKAKSEGKRLGRPRIAPELEQRIRAALPKPGHPGVRKIAEQFGVNA